MFHKKGVGKELYRFGIEKRAVKNRFSPVWIMTLSLMVGLGLAAFGVFEKSANPASKEVVPESINFEVSKEPEKVKVEVEVVNTNPLIFERVIWNVADLQYKEYLAIKTPYDTMMHYPRKLIPEKKELKVGEFGLNKTFYDGQDVLLSLSYYWPPLGGINCDTLPDGKPECEYMASGLLVADWVGVAVACPAEWPFYTRIQFDDREFICLDRGGAIIKNPDGSYWIDVLYPMLPGRYWSQIVNGKVKIPTP